MIQINTSNEPRRFNFKVTFNRFLSIQIIVFKLEKGGISPSDLVQVFKHVNEKCTNLNVLGLMTIGSYEQSTNENEINLDFKVVFYLINYVRIISR